MQKHFPAAPLRCGLVIITALICLSGFSTSASAMDFPYRKDYPGVRTIDSEKLFRGYQSGEILIVDVRHRIDFDEIHPQGALSIPIDKKGFVNNVKSLIEKNAGKKIAFYCNGTTCPISYKASQKAQEAGLENCFAYDAGISVWALLFPAKTERLGNTLKVLNWWVSPKGLF